MGYLCILKLREVRGDGKRVVADTIRDVPDLPTPGLTVSRPSLFIIFFFVVIFFFDIFFVQVECVQ